MGKASARRDVQPVREPAPVAERDVVRGLRVGRVLLAVPQAQWRDLCASRQQRRAHAQSREYRRLAEKAERSYAYQKAEALMLAEERRSRMVDPMAQAQVEAEIHRLSRRLDRVTEDVAAASTRAAQGEVDYKLGYARAMLAVQGVKATVPVKEAKALLEVDEEFAEWKLADAELRALQETGRNLRSQLDALRSVNANVRSVVTNP